MPGKETRWREQRKKERQPAWNVSNPPYCTRLCTCDHLESEIVRLTRDYLDMKLPRWSLDKGMMHPEQEAIIAMLTAGFEVPAIRRLTSDSTASTDSTLSEKATNTLKLLEEENVSSIWDLSDLMSTSLYGTCLWTLLPKATPSKQAGMSNYNSSYSGFGGQSLTVQFMRAINDPKCGLDRSWRYPIVAISMIVRRALSVSDIELSATRSARANGWDVTVKDTPNLSKDWINIPKLHFPISLRAVEGMLELAQEFLYDKTSCSTFDEVMHHILPNCLASACKTIMEHLERRMSEYSHDGNATSHPSYPFVSDCWQKFTSLEGTLKTNDMLGPLYGETYVWQLINKVGRIDQAATLEELKKMIDDPKVRSTVEQTQAAAVGTQKTY